MANFHLIREFAEKNKITLRELATRIGVKEGAIQKIIKNGSTNTKTLEEIAKILNVPVGVFFDNETCNSQNIVTGNGNVTSIYGNSISVKLADKDKEIEHLKMLLEEKERTIQILLKEK